MTMAPRSASSAATVDLPDPPPPLSPMRARPEGQSATARQANLRGRCDGAWMLPAGELLAQRGQCLIRGQRPAGLRRLGRVGRRLAGVGRSVRIGLLGVLELLL